MSKRIVVLGAGYGGLEAAKSLHRHLKRDQDVEITLIDMNDYHTLLTELHEVAGDRVETSGVKVSIQHVLEYTKVKFVQDRIVRGDLNKKVLYSEKAEYPFDYLILGIGSEPAYYGITGMEEHSFTLWSLEDAVRIREHIVSMFEQAQHEKDPKVRRELLTFIVGGGGFTGIEMMGELIQWTRYMAKDYGFSRDEIQLMVIEALPTILPVLKDKLIKKSVRFMEKNGVKILTDSPITEVTPTSVSIKSGESFPSRTLIWTGGIQAKGFVKDMGISLGRRNRVIVNEYLQTKEFPYVYAIGDVMEFTDKDGEIMPPLVETALYSAKAAAENIAAEIHNKEKKPFKAKLHGVMVSIGSVYAVADVMGMSMSWLFATAMKHLVNMHYLFEVGGLEMIRDYVNDQFIHKSRKGHWLLDQGLSHIKVKTFTFWMALIRIWLGIMWLFEGIKKYNSGWFEWEMIGAAGASAATSAATAAADATSSASLMALISDHTPGWYAWIVETIIYPNAMFFQKLIVLTEIGLGLAFITGTFTVIAAIVSIGMNINFMLTTGLPPHASTGLPDLWLLITSTSMLGGGGRAFGLDHYIMPFLRNRVRWFQRREKKAKK